MTKKKQSTESAVREIRRQTRRKFSPEEKTREGPEAVDVVASEGDVLQVELAGDRQTGAL